MEYLKVSIETTSEYAELLGDALAEITGGCEIDDPNNIDELTHASAPRWDYIEEGLYQKREGPAYICFYIAADEAGADTLRAVAQRVALIKEEDGAGACGRLKIEVTSLGSQDWENEWKKYFKPTNIGTRLVIKPSWEALEPGQNKIILTIDPAASFGTGTHATTRMCLETLDGMDLGGKQVLDMGCGSGILSCAALLLGAAGACCCDIEAAAMATTDENMEKNGIAKSRYRLVEGDAIADQGVFDKLHRDNGYDVILANIVADVLIALAPKLWELISKNGVIIMSGIIDERAAEVIEACHLAGLAVLAERHSDGWTMLCLTKAGNNK